MTIFSDGTQDLIYVPNKKKLKNENEKKDFSNTNLSKIKE